MTIYDRTLFGAVVIVMCFSAIVFSPVWIPLYLVGWLSETIARRYGYEPTLLDDPW